MEQLFLTNDPQTSAALANFYLLTSIGLCPPTPELVHGLVDGSFFSDYLECTQLLAPCDLRYAAQAYYGRAADVVYQELNREYTRLFVSPRHELVPLYESLIVHPDEKVSMFINQTAMHCDQVYRKTGFAYEEKNKFPADHVGIELRFFACLLLRRLQALENGNQEEAGAAAQALSDFAAQHLARWAKPFAAQVTLHTQIPFYTALADLLAQIAPARQ